MPNNPSALFVMVLLLLAPAAVRAQSFTIDGDIPKPLTLTLEDLRQMPASTVATADHHTGAKAVYDGVPLRELLKRAGAPTGKDLKGKMLASYLLASAKDGYEVVFSLAELDPEFRDQPAIVAFSRDGKPLTAEEGPFRLVSDSDKKPARSIRMLTGIRIVLLRK